MTNLPDQDELKSLVDMAKNFEIQMKEQAEIARKIAMECEQKTTKLQQSNQSIENKLDKIKFHSSI